MRRNGFSLVEFLAVVAMVALLLAIMLPALTAAKDKGKSVIC